MGLAISVSGDELTATYTATAAAGSALGKQAESDDSSNAGSDLVDNVLGDVTVAECHYGFTEGSASPITRARLPSAETVSAMSSRLICVCPVAARTLVGCGLRVRSGSATR